MAYFLIITAALLTVFLLSRLRLRLLLSPERKLLFVGLGRTGPEFDFVGKVIRVKLFGFKILQLSMRKTEPPTIEQLKPTRLETAETAKKTHPKRQRSFGLLVEILSESTKAVWRYVVAIFKGIIVEQAEGELSFGFDSPDMTGKVFGYYHAVAWAAPGLAGRLNLVPNFSGKSVTGRASVTIALPMYVFVYRTAVLLVHMPIRKIIRYSRGSEKGASHGE